MDEKIGVKASPNIKPTISTVTVSNVNENGSYRLTFTILDDNNDKMTVELKVGALSYKNILENQGNGQKTYDGTGLSHGTHKCTLRVRDGEGRESITSNVFIITIPNSSGNALQEALNGFKAELAPLKEKMQICQDKIAEGKASVVDKKYANLILDPNTGIQAQVGSIKNKVNDHDGAIKQAQTTATNAQNQANKALDNANNAISNLNDMARDTKISPTEKKMLDRDYKDLVKEKDGLIAQANVYSIVTTNYTNSFNSLHEYLYNSTNGLLLDLSTTTDIVKATFNEKFNNYYVERQKIFDEIAKNTKKFANDKFNESKAYTEEKVAEVAITPDDIIMTVSGKLVGESNNNIIQNSTFKFGEDKWARWNWGGYAGQFEYSIETGGTSEGQSPYIPLGSTALRMSAVNCQDGININCGLYQSYIAVDPNKDYTLSLYIGNHRCTSAVEIKTEQSGNVLTSYTFPIGGAGSDTVQSAGFNNYQYKTLTFNSGNRTTVFLTYYIHQSIGGNSVSFLSRLMLTKGTIAKQWEEDTYGYDNLGGKYNDVKNDFTNLNTKYTEFKQDVDGFKLTVGERTNVNNIVDNGSFIAGLNNWSATTVDWWTGYVNYHGFKNNSAAIKNITIASGSTNEKFLQSAKAYRVKPHTVYTLSFSCKIEHNVHSMDVFVVRSNTPEVDYAKPSGVFYQEGDYGTDNINGKHFTTTFNTEGYQYVWLRFDHNGMKNNVNVNEANWIYVSEVAIYEGDVGDIKWTPNPNEITGSTVQIDKDKIIANYENGTYTAIGRDGFKWKAPDMEYQYHFLSYHDAFSIMTSGGDNYIYQTVKLPARFNYVDLNTIHIVGSLKGWYKYVNAQWFTIENITVSTGLVTRDSNGTYAQIAARGHVRIQNGYTEGIGIVCTLHVTA